MTMKWWDDIWLNEGFATFMAPKPLMAWHPEWRVDLDQVGGTLNALSIDSTRTTRPIRQKAETRNEINALFDGIAYGKTAAVLRMEETWVGEETFRDGIRAYLKKFSYGNAAAEDWWGTMTTATKQPFDVVMKSFVDQTGAPLLHAAEACGEDGKRTVTISQERLLPRSAPAAPQSWTIPICGHETGAPAASPCRLISKPIDTYMTAACDRPIFLSRNGAGYFVTDYSATMRSGLRALVAAIGNNIEFLNSRLVDDTNRAAWQAYVRQVMRGYAPLTWEGLEGETAEQRIVRAYVLGVLGVVGQDPEVIAGARRVAEQYMNDPSSVDAVIANR